MLLTDHTPNFARNLSGKEQARWRGRLLRSTTEAMIYWAPAPHTGFNDALAFFIQTLNKKDMNGLVPRATAGDWLISKLSGCDTNLVSVALFERLIHGCQVWLGKTSLRVRFSSAKLWLNHPGGPRPDAALELLRHVDLHREDFFETKDDPFDYAVAKLMARTAHSLHKMGRSREAEEVLDIFQKRLPDLFSGIARSRASSAMNHDAVMAMLLIDDADKRSAAPSFSSARGKALLSHAVAVRRANYAGYA